MKKSITLSAFFPSSKTNPERLKKALSEIEQFDISTVEYYIEGCSADKIGNLLGGWESVFLSAVLQKQCNLNPSSDDMAERKKAVELLSDNMRFAEQAGAKYVLLNSGARPADEKKDGECIKYLRESLCELHQAARGVDLLLEPGDRDVEYRHLIGHLNVADAFIQDIRQDIPSIGLVFDISHIAQLGENLADAWNIAKRSCAYVHLANCSLVIGNQYYGDKHPPFGIDGGVYSHKDAYEFYNGLIDENQHLNAGIEIICTEEAEEEFFTRIAEETDWFFNRK